MGAGGLQDGGAGSAGEITGSAGDGWVTVKWLATGGANSYRVGPDEFDLARLQLSRYERAMSGIASVMVRARTRAHARIHTRAVRARTRTHARARTRARMQAQTQCTRPHTHIVTHHFPPSSRLLPSLPAPPPLLSSPPSYPHPCTSR